MTFVLDVIKDIEDWDHVWVCEANEFEVEEIIRNSIHEFNDGSKITCSNRKEKGLGTIYNDNFNKITNKKEHNLDLKNLWNFCYDKVRSKVWLKRCEFFAELEKERGLEKKDLRKRKEIPTKDKNDDTELDNKYKKREKQRKI
ncbi:hypothetical protein RhiirA5_429552 [Rhizophagus irregularis]|uniref:Uncharacterized protein n=1 Tax=Rhizophagus irregularis TaxID=588596 RepID=A0A2N0NY72_9GLOM|nr:hypothetical protein RhiirA5_429552 [Rhizophagus irregularis]